MMPKEKGFDVSDRSLNLNQNYLLEASAGTGKTYSIENIFVRLLIASEPLLLEQILVVTFTRAATRDLKMRIRNHIVKSIDCLLTENSTSHDYLLHILEHGFEAKERAIKLLEQALFCFDQAQIFTIHSFCNRILNEFVFEGDFSFTHQTGEKGISGAKLLQAVHDFLRTELKFEICSKQQLKILLKEYRQNFDDLIQDLAKTVAKGSEIQETPSYKEQFAAFQKGMQKLKKEIGCSSDRILEDYDALMDVTDGRGKKSALSDRMAIQRFTSLFDCGSWDENDFESLLKGDFELFQQKWPPLDKIKKGKITPPLHAPQLFSRVQAHLAPAVLQASNPKMIFARLAFACQKHVCHYLEAEELFDYDQILKVMHKGTKHPPFVHQIRSRYQAAIIDEFQDTDPMQWEIFQALFLEGESPSHRLFLVGDPKQSIYAFRRADIYTYLSAANALGENCKASLNTNYRSHPHLVHALNALFDSRQTPDMIHLPRLSLTLEYHPVRGGEKVTAKDFHDERGCVHFFTLDLASQEKKSLKDAESNFLFPFIVKEIQRLNHQEGVAFKQFAILVKDRFQAERLNLFLKKWQIPASNQRNTTLEEAPAISALRELLQAIKAPRHVNSLKIALGGPVLGWTHEEIKALEDLNELERVMIAFYELREILMQDGMGGLFQQLMRLDLKKQDETVSEKMLRREGGYELYQDLLLLTERLAEEGIRKSPSFDSLFITLEEINGSPEAEKGVKRRIDPDQDAVQILTIHNSKGLEYEIVFALGLVVGKEQNESFYPHVDASGCHKLQVADENDPLYLKHCEELDAEKMRQLYVATTRAKQRLYVPALFGANKQTKPGDGSSMELFCARFGYPPASDSSELYQRISKEDGQRLIEWVALHGKECKISHCYLDRENLELSVLKKPEALALIPPRQVHIQENKQFLYSFTSLSQTDKRENFETDKSPPQDFSTQLKSPHSLPAGNEIGTLLHKILEDLPFHQGSHPEFMSNLKSFIYPYVANTPFEEWQEVISKVIFNALHTPLPFQGKKTSLACLDGSKMYKESEFLYPWEGNGMAVPEMKPVSGFLKGVIDLICQHEGKYYLLDWKSNWLGPDKQDYNLKALKLAMGEHNYHLQAAIYTEALKRYLHAVDPRAFNEIFGGVFYLFLRGLDPHSDDNEGIYHFFPSHEEILCN